MIKLILFFIILILGVTTFTSSDASSNENQKAQVDQSGKKWDGSHYSTNKLIQFKGAMDQIESYPFKGTEAVLDLGSGDGVLTFNISERTKGEVLGIDKDPSMIRFSSQRYKTPQLKFEKKSLLEIDYKNRFDLVTSFNTLHWEKKQEIVLQKIHAALKDGGAFMAGIPSILPPEKNVGTSMMVHIIKKLMFEKKWYKYFTKYKNEWRFFTKEEYEKLLTDAKFKVEKVEVTIKTFPMDNKEMFKGWMKSILPQLSYLPASQREIFLDEIVAEFIKIFPVESDGKLNVTHAQLEINAKKL